MILENIKKASSLRNESIDNLSSSVADIRNSLFSARTASVNKKSNKQVNEIKNIRKSLARVKTILHEKLRAEAIESYKGKKHIPRELKPKLTRAMRRRLTKKQKDLKVPRVARLNKEWANKKIMVFC